MNENLLLGLNELSTVNPALLYLKTALFINLESF
jgi:hypothetical protein